MRTKSTILMHPGIPAAERDRQLALFTQGVAPTRLERACTPGDGILQLERPEDWAAIYRQAAVDVVKFVPASGAASRMFKHVFAYPDNAQDPLIKELLVRFHELPFYPVLKARMEAQGQRLDERINTGRWEDVLDAMVGPHGLGYGGLPKGLVHFHASDDQVLTAFEEHLFEGLQYAQKNGQVRIHFTVPAAHLKAIETHVAERVNGLSKRPAFDISYSVQFPHTDTVCVDLNNALVTDENGQPLYRPGGHGALIHNLAQVDADVIFIKNIDNVQPAHLRSDTVLYKEALAGMLLEIKGLFDQALRDDAPSDQALEWLARMGHDVEAFDATGLRKAMDRPLRICGMVRNEGEPGGGPFWVRQPSGEVTAQIVEKAQIDTSDPTQAALVSGATHFNPVDLVCSTRRCTGNPYTLTDFVDPQTSFITQKSIGGRPVKALEHPGLWNGAMAGWNTVFVEVPITTFSPVKTVNDLLRAQHQPN